MYVQCRLLNQQVPGLAAPACSAESVYAGTSAHPLHSLFLLELDLKAVPPILLQPTVVDDRLQKGTFCSSEGCHTDGQKPSTVDMVSLPLKFKGRRLWVSFGSLVDSGIC